MKDISKRQYKYKKGSVVFLKNCHYVDLYFSIWKEDGYIPKNAKLSDIFGILFDDDAIVNKHNTLLVDVYYMSIDNRIDVMLLAKGIECGLATYSDAIKWLL